MAASSRFDGGFALHVLSFRGDAQHRTRNLEIPGSREDACPGNDISIVIEDPDAQRQVMISVPRARHCPPRRAMLHCASRPALPEIPPAGIAGFKPELS
jgi:hypothetical protein